MSCKSRKTKPECEKAGLLAKIANCKWNILVGECHRGGRVSSSKTNLPKARQNAKLTTKTTSKATKSIKSTKSPADCEVPACSTKTNMFARLVQQKKIKKNQSTTTTSTSISEPEDYKKTPKELAHSGQCPAGRADLGWQSWTLLHSIAAYYPDAPTSEDQTRAKQFIESLSHLYPCTHCAEDFREDLKEMPVELESRTSFSVWMCRMHNRVNSKIGKSEYSCNIDALDLRWRKNAYCEGESGEEAAASLNQDM